MSQTKLLSSNWVKSFLREEDISQEKLKVSFDNAATYRIVLRQHIKRELELLDKLSQLSKLKDVPNRAELLLAYAAKREALNNLLEYCIDD